MYDDDRGGACCIAQFQFEEAGMAYLVIAVTLAALYSGFSPVPVFVLGTGLVIAVAYGMSRHPALLRLGGSFTGYAVTHVLLSRLDADVLAAASDVERSVMEFGASDKVMLTVAALVMFIAVMVGQIGRRIGDPVSGVIRNRHGKS